MGGSGRMDKNREQMRKKKKSNRALCLKSGEVGGGSASGGSHMNISIRPAPTENLRNYLDKVIINSIHHGKLYQFQQARKIMFLFLCLEPEVSYGL
jgi:hypothetical protein